MTDIATIPANSPEPSLSQAESATAVVRSTRAKPYSNFRFRAVVDWISLQIVTQRPTNFDTVRTRMGIPFADAVDEGPGKAATEFSFRIQEPSSWASIHKALERLTHDHPLACPVVVTGIEISLDAYSRTNDRDELVDMVARFYKFATNIVSDNRRTSGKGRGSSQGMATYRGLRQRLEEGFNIYVGDEDDPIYQHMYVKETNRHKNVLVMLNHNERRARTEFTLTGNALPHFSLSDWENHDFTMEADHFKYRKLKNQLRHHSSAAVLDIDQIGQKKIRRRACGGTRLFSVNTVADTALNDLAYAALRELTRRMNS